MGNYDVRYILLAFALRYNNDWTKIFEAIKNHDDIDDLDYQLALNHKCNFIDITDTRYPTRMKHGFRPPFILYYEGDLDLLKRVDDFPNDLVFLYGKNVKNIPKEHLCFIDDDGKLDICGRLKIWSNLDDLSRFLMPHYICQSIVCCNKYSTTKGPKTKFGSIVLPTALESGCDIYMLPTDGPSFNNDLIEQGATSFESVVVIPSLEPLPPF